MKSIYIVQHIAHMDEDGDTDDSGFEVAVVADDAGQAVALVLAHHPLHDPTCSLIVRGIESIGLEARN